jgi:hypothetical protein
MAENTSTYKAVIEIDTEPSISELKKLKKQLKDTAAGSEEFAVLQQKINDTEDAIKAARTGASNFTEVANSALFNYLDFKDKNGYAQRSLWDTTQWWSEFIKVSDRKSVV